METKKIDSNEFNDMLKKSYMIECQNIEAFREKKLNEIKDITIQVTKAKELNELATLKNKAQKIRTYLENDKETLCKRPAFSVNGKSYNYPAFYELLINKVTELIKYIESQTQEVAITNPTIKIPILKEKKEKKKEAENFLIVLAGYWLNGNKIMTEADYKTVIEGVFYLIDYEKVKEIKKPINTKASMQFIRKLFRELNRNLYGNRIKDYFIEFLHAYFECFSGSNPTTTKNQFNQYSNINFENDYNKIKESIKK